MSNPETIRDHGDDLEKFYANEVLERLSGYAFFWARYIGNDGQAGFLTMPKVGQEVLEARQQVWEHLYTMFESFALCWRLEVRFSKLAPITNQEVYLDNLNDWMAFFAHLGRIHDMAEKVAQRYDGKNLFAPFDDANHKRHMVLHYPKVPMKWVENILAAPEVTGQRLGWKPKKPWSVLEGQDLKFIHEIVESTLRPLEKVANNFFYQVIELAAKQGGFVPVEWPSAVPKTDATAQPLPQGQILRNNNSGTSTMMSGVFR